MTREEAIEEIRDTFTDEWADEMIQALEQEPCDDCISRKEAINSIEWWFGVLKQNPDILIDSIKTLPSVQPTRILDNATNGDVIKAMFPKEKFEKGITVVHNDSSSNFMSFDYSWWNAPYKENKDETIKNNM